MPVETSVTRLAARNPIRTFMVLSRRHRCTLPTTAARIAGRREDVLNRGGVKLATTDFEEFLLAAPGVRDAGVCSMMGEAGFAEIWVGVALEDGADIGKFRLHIESDQKFSGNIDKMFVVDEIPRGENRKLQREQLQVMLKSIVEED